MDGLLGFIIFIAICFLSSSANKKKTGAKTTSAKPAESPSAPQQRAPQPKERPSSAPGMQTPPAARTAEARPQSQQKYYDSTCMQANAEHDHNRRMEQLRDFLKDGIIDKEEYNILLAKYQRYR